MMKLLLIHKSSIGKFIGNPENVKISQLLKLIFFIFLPIVCSFLLPLLLYKLPIRIRTIDGVVELLNIEIAYATFVWVVWLSVVFAISISLARKFKWESNDYGWSAVTLWRAFLILSIGGGLISLTHYFISFNGSIEQLIVQLSLSPAIAIIVGIKLLQKISSFNNVKRTLILVVTIIFFVVNSFNAIVLPLLLGISANVVYAGLPIMFAVHAFRVNTKKVIIAWLMLILFILVALGFKNEFRTSGIGSFLWHNEQYIRISASDFSLRKIDEFFTADRNSNSTDKNVDKKLIFTEYDPNYRSIRFFPEDGILKKIKYFFARSIHRVNHLSELAYVIKMTPKKVPYLYCASYYPLIFKPIPRVIWKDKPEDKSGQIFGHRYALLYPSDKTTSVNMGIIVEAWVNGGWVVLLITSLLFGILIHFCWKYLIGESAQIGNVIRAAVLVASAASNESSLNLVVGGIFYAMLVWLPIEWLIRTKL